MNSVISELLETHLDIIAKRFNLPVAYENIGFETRNDTYLKSNLLPAITTSFDLEGKLRSYSGVYQISIVVPIGTGKSKSQELAEAIINHFHINLELTKNEFLLYINSIPSAYPAIIDKSTYITPISMNYRADLSI